MELDCIVFNIPLASNGIVCPGGERKKFPHVETGPNIMVVQLRAIDRTQIL